MVVKAEVVNLVMNGILDICILVFLLSSNERSKNLTLFVVKSLNAKLTA